MRKTPTHKKQSSKSLKKKKKDKQRKKKILKDKENQKLLRKEMDKRLQVVEQVISSMPTTCQFCDKEFDPKLAEHLDNWKFRLEDTGMSLTCNLCE